MSGARATTTWRFVLVLAVMGAVVASCVRVETTPSPETSPQASALASASAPATPSLVAPTIGPVPSGDWTSISWTRLDGKLAAGYPSIVQDILAKADDGSEYVLEGPNIDLETVKGGYLQLLWDPYKRTMTPWLSSDAQSWKRGEPFDLSAWKAAFAEWDKLAESQLDRDGCGFVIDDFAAATSGIVVRAQFACSWGCGGEYLSDEAMWASPDGLAWTPVDLGKTFGKTDIDRIYGGGNGLIGLTPNRKASWTSTDGRAWRRGTVPADAFEIADPVSIDSGFVIGGTVRVQTGPQIEPGDKCGISLPTAGGRFQAVAWLSRDGLTWERSPISPTLTDNATVSVLRVDDHTIIATVTSVVAEVDQDEDGTTYWSEVDESYSYWLSHDGRTWTQLSASSASWLPFAIPGFERGLITGEQDYEVARDGSLRVLTESAAPANASFGGVGEMPKDDFARVIGPVGVLATDGKTFWLGVPSAG